MDRGGDGLLALMMAVGGVVGAVAGQVTVRECPGLTPKRPGGLAQLTTGVSPQLNALAR